MIGDKDYLILQKFKENFKFKKFTNFDKAIKQTIKS